MSDKKSTGTFDPPPATGGKAIGENGEQQNKKPDPFFSLHRKVTTTGDIFQIIRRRQCKSMQRNRLYLTQSDQATEVRTTRGLPFFVPSCESILVPAKGEARGRAKQSADDPILFLFPDNTIDLPAGPCYDCCHKCGRLRWCDAMRQTLQAEHRPPSRLLHTEALRPQVNRSSRTACARPCAHAITADEPNRPTVAIT